ncbi:hypothetical protein JW935_05070 [candidate division KSB1 bacterium]|nr:hypothetical protein [candidate division KSB1 bacterium]
MRKNFFIFLFLFLGCRRHNPVEHQQPRAFTKSQYIGRSLKNTNVVCVDNPYGGLVATGWGFKDTLFLQLNKTITAPTSGLAEKHFDLLAADLQISGDTLWIVLPWMLSGEVNYDHCSVNLNLPYRSELTVQYCEGSIFVDQLDGKILVDRGRDKVKIDNHTGSCRISAVGDIDVTTVLSDSGFCLLTSETGDVLLFIPQTANADVLLETFYGRVRFSGLSFLTLDQQYNRLAGILGTGSARIRAASIWRDVVLTGF